MNGLCGWFGDLHAAPDDTLRGMLAAGPHPVPDPAVQKGPDATLAAYATDATARRESRDGVVLAWVGHPRMQVRAGAAFDPAAFVRAWRAQGASALAGVQGDFALAAWDTQRRRGLIAIDRIGVHQLVYAGRGEQLVFASTLDQLRAHPSVVTRLSPQGIYDYLYFHVCPGPGTIFEGLRRLPAGHCVEFGSGATASPSAYWAMRFEEDPAQPLPALEQEFIELLRGAVKTYADGAACGAFLSGGTDSSTLSGMLGRVSGAPARAFSIGFDAAGYDEMEYARIAARHFGCEHHEYYVTPQDVVDAVPKIAQWYDQPFGNASAIPTYYCARFAREHGVQRLLAGDGGDELFGGNERYGKQHLLGLYQRVPGVLRRGVIEPLLLSLPSDLAVMPLRKLRSYVEQARPSMPLRYQSYNLLNYLGQQNVFTPEFLGAVDAGHPLALLEESHAPYADASLINQMLAIDLRFILADGDLPKVTQMCALAGVDVAFPLLDEPLVAFSSRLPAPMKLRGTTLRWFFKHALRDFLPPAVITKTKHGFGLPVGSWLTGHKPLRDLAHDSIGRLRQRGIIQPRFIDDLFDKRLQEHAAFFGGMVWTLMMLGLWLESRRL